MAGLRPSRFCSDHRLIGAAHGLRFVALAAFAGVALVIGTAPPVAAASPDFGSGDAAWNNYYAHPTETSTWGPFCAGGGGSVIASADGIPACGPTGGTDIEVPGGIDTPGFQCVELSERWLDIAHGWTAISANGAQVAERYASAHHVRLVTNGTSGVAPQVGDVMSFSDSSSYSDTGHTGVITASNVNSSGNGTIQLLSENVSDTGNLSTFSVSGWRVAEIFGYPDSEWIQSGSGGLLSNGSYIEVTGSSSVYQVVGGAAVAVNNWNDVPTPHTVKTVTQAQFNSLAEYPANGTAVYDDTPGTSHGTGYVFVGGAPLFVKSWTDIGSPSILGVDGYSLSHYATTGAYSHVRQYPANGTAVFVANPGAGHGAGYVFAGGAPTSVQDWKNVGSPKITGVDSYALDNPGVGALSHVRRYPLDGTAVFVDNPGPSHGTGYVFAGGAPIAVTNWTFVGSPPISGVDSFSLTSSPAIGHALQYPADNTYLDADQTGQVFRVVGGVATYLPSWSAVGGVKPYTTVDALALDRAGTGGAYNHLISSSPTARMTRPHAHTRPRKHMTFTWTSSPQASAITSYDLRVRDRRGHKAAKWTQPKLLQGTSDTAATLRLTQHHQLCVSVRAHDLAGMTGAWSKRRCIARN